MRGITLWILIFIAGDMVLAQSPTCNINQIIQTFSNAGYTQLNVQGQPCSMYFYNNASQSANDAQAAARNLGVHLVSIQSQAENDAIQQALIAAGFSNAVVWIGGGFTGSAHGPNDFVWYDGSPVNYTNWNPGEPNNNSGGVGPENCIQMIVNSGRWNDLVCGAEPFGLGPRGTSVIEVNLCPQLTVTGGGQPVCTGGQVTLHAHTILGATPYNYTWYEFPNPVSVGTGSTFTPTVHNNTIFVASVIDRYGCSDTAQVSVITQACNVPQGCNLTAIRQAFQNAGYAELNVQGQPCALYFYNTNNQSATAAQNAAAALGTHLVSIHSQAENDAIQQALIQAGFSNAVVWIGGRFNTAAHGPNDFTWYDGSPVVYTNWNPGEPNNNSGGVGPENCIQMIVNTGRWNDLVCDAQPFGLGPKGTSVIKVNLCPEITISGGAQPLCSGQSTQLSASAILGSTPYTFVWNNGAGTGANVTVSPPVTTTYTVTVTDRWACMASDSVTVNVWGAPNQSFIVQPSVVCAGTPVTVTYTGTSSSGATYNWNFGGATVLSGSGQGPYQIVFPNAASTNITLNVTENGCPSPQVSQSVAVNMSAVAAIAVPLTTVCSGETVTLTASGGNSYFWNTGDTTAEIVVTPSSTTTYVVAVVNSAGCADSTSVTISVNPDIVFSVISTHPTCGGNNGSLTVNVSSPGMPTFTWSANASTGNNATANNLPAGIYAVTVSQNGCSRDTLITLISPDAISFNFTNIVHPGCSGNDGIVTLNLSGGTVPYTVDIDTGGTSFTLSIPAAGSLLLSNLNAGTITASVTDHAGCQANASVTLNAPANCCGFVISILVTNPTCGASDGTIDLTVLSGSGNYTYLWNNNATSPDLSGIPAGNYRVTVTDVTQNCSRDTSVNLTSAGAPVVNSVNVTDETCLGAADGTITLIVSGGTGTLSFLWNNNATTQNLSGLIPGNYSVTIIDSDGCVATVSAIVNEGPVCCTLIGSVEVVQPDCFNPDGSITILLDTASGTPPFQYSINGGQNFSSGNSFNNVPAGNYYIIVRDVNFCVFTQQVNIIPLNIVSVNLGADRLLCAGESAVLDAGNTGIAYLWNNGETTQTLFVNSAGVFSVTVTDANGCTASDEVNVTYADIFLDAGQDTTIVRNSSVTLFASVSGSTTSGSFVWTPSLHLSCSTCQNPVASPHVSTTYTVTYTDNNSCIATDTVHITVIEGEYFFWMPNAFSPNSDGENDILFPYHKGVKQYTLRIYNRWGGKVFECISDNCAWNGSLNGKILDPAVFVWEAVVEYKKPSVERYKGSITLIR